MSKDTITVNMNVHDIPIVVEALKKANKEIERLNNIIKELDKQNRQLGEKLSLTTDKYEKKLFIKENIIKEVREYIEPLVELDNDIMLKGKMLKPVLELVKENK